jgi:hypothetical protein
MMRGSSRELVQARDGTLSGSIIIFALATGLLIGASISILVIAIIIS